MSGSSAGLGGKKGTKTAGKTGSSSALLFIDIIRLWGTGPGIDKMAFRYGRAREAIVEHLCHAPFA
jgi:hypothetical protein